MSKNSGTYLIEFSNGHKIVCGNNYKDWLTHATEYAWSKFQSGRPHDNLVSAVQFSDTPFVDDGGLKYASPEAYQEIIDEETARDGKKRTAFKDIKFYYSNADKKKLDANLKYWGLV